MKQVAARARPSCSRSGRCPADDLQRLIELGVDDSKTLSAAKRDELNEIICKERNWLVSIIECSPERIDLTMEKKTLNDLEVDLFGEAINGLGINNIEEIILDATIPMARFGRNVSSKVSNLEVVKSVISRHGADGEYPVVGGGINRSKSIVTKSSNPSPRIEDSMSVQDIHLILTLDLCCSYRMNTLIQI